MVQSLRGSPFGERSFGHDSQRFDLRPKDLNLSYSHESPQHQHPTVKLTKPAAPRGPRVNQIGFWDRPAQYIVSLRDIPKLNTNMAQNENIAESNMAEYTREVVRRPSTSSETSDLRSPSNKPWDDDAEATASPAANSENISGSAQSHSDSAAKDDDVFSHSGVGLGKVSSGTNAIQNRFARFSSTYYPRPPKQRAPSWKADASSPEAKIDLGVKQIIKFMQSVQHGTDTFDSDKAFKLFIDANKEIVRAWGGLEENLRRKPAGITLGEKVDCMHAILLNLSKEVAEGGGWVRGALEMSELSLEFCREWEILMNKDLGARKWASSNATRRKPVDNQSLESDESMEYIAPEEILTPQKLAEGDDETKNNINRVEVEDVEHLGIVDDLLPIVEPHASGEIASSRSTSSTTSIRQFKLKPRIKNSISISSERVNKLPSSVEEESSKLPPAINIAHEQYTHILKRLDDIEASIKQNNHQAILEAVEMHALITKDIHGAVYGENAVSPKQAAATRLGLWQLADDSADHHREYVRKLSNVEEAVNATRDETEELRREVEKLHAVREQTEEINTYAQSWLSEAWDNVIDEFWPHGAPTDEAVGNQAGGGCTMMKGGGCTMMKGGGCTVMQSGGCTTMQTGGCTTMQTGGCTTMQTGGCTTMQSGGCTTMQSGGCTVMQNGGCTTMKGGGRTTMKKGGGCTVMSTKLDQAKSQGTETDLLNLAAEETQGQEPALAM
ncbi:hypothetical protein GLAREA_05333 [Glarea lozoyensis ATCC 20868]|uniref:Uncharacterized protein n=1 Tax=Glarea lozoyensis (strain ATCC 20868 / MF5171) TaxID=1116229 RepID=S3DE10_GLAL2|nr:uncharacterized protein GLAREA_05333 [Glarea lozoyensis ATCC 20868]EPE35995.1 hypothetical protein GLAREA_05333 [Glarea lozoyensis ATCC 20868]